MEERGNWKIKTSKKVYENPWISVDHHEVIDPSGKDGLYGLVHFKNKALAVLPIDSDLNTYIVGQFRFATNEYSWEVPEGGGTLQLSSEREALRELKEETGIQADSLYPFLEMHLSNSVTDEKSKSFVAFDLNMNPPQPDTTEKITVRKVALGELFGIVEKGLIKDALSVASLMRLELILLKNQLSTYEQVKNWFTLHS